MDAVLGPIGHHFLDELDRRLGKSGGGGFQVDGVLLDGLELLHRGGVRVEGRLPGEGVIQGRAEAVDVPEKRVGGAFELLRRHIVGRRPEIFREVLASLLQGEAEVDELGRALCGHQHVAGLDVAVDQVLLVGGLQTTGDVEGDAEHLGFGKRPLVGDELLEADRLQQLHRDEEVAMVLADGEDLDDVGMDDRRGEFRLALEHRGERHIAAQRLVQDLQGDLAAEVPVERAEDLAHPALAERSDDLVLADRGAHPDEGGAMRTFDLRVGRKSRHVQCLPALGAVGDQGSIGSGFFHQQIAIRSRDRVKRQCIFPRAEVQTIPPSGHHCFALPDNHHNHPKRLPPPGRRASVTLAFDHGRSTGHRRRRALPPRRGSTLVHSRSLRDRVGGIPPEIGPRIREIADTAGVDFVFKASYDKANRSSVKSFRGLGCEEGCRLLAEVGASIGAPVTTDIHTAEEAVIAAEFIDVLQIPAFLCRQTDLLEAAARTGRVVNVKKGQFLAPWDVKNIADKLEAFGCRNYFITERGTTFGYNNLVADMRAIPWMHEAGVRVVFDATHSVQRPGGEGQSSGGDGRLAPVLAASAVAAGCDGVFMETHPDPSKALSDGPNQVPLDRLGGVLTRLRELYELVRRPVL